MCLLQKIHISVSIQTQRMMSSCIAISICHLIRPNGCRFHHSRLHQSRSNPNIPGEQTGGQINYVSHQIKDHRTRECNMYRGEVKNQRPQHLGMRHVQMGKNSIHGLLEVKASRNMAGHTGQSVSKYQTPELSKVELVLTLVSA